MTAPIVKRVSMYSVEEQTSREDVANAVQLLDDVKRTAMNCDFQSLERALVLLRRALTKSAP
jgi:hypothetical protein